MKLSTIWEDFDEFSQLCLKSGTIETKHKMKIQLTFFNEKNEYDGDWKKLFEMILSIFCNDKRIAYKFDYSTKEFIQTQQYILGRHLKTSHGVRKGLFEILTTTYRKINENGDVQFFNSVNKSNTIKDTIYLTPTVVTGIDKQLDIYGSTIRKEKDIFKATVGDFVIIITYINNEFVSAINNDTKKNVRISKYPEIIRFINAKYYNKHIEKLSYNQFKYLVLSFSSAKPFLLVPSEEDGYLSSVVSKKYIKNLDDARKYFSIADERFENIRFTFKMIAYNNFELDRKNDKDIDKAITDTQNQYGDMKAKFPFSPRATQRSFMKNDEQKND